jgi:hypothetical protein
MDRDRVAASRDDRPSSLALGPVLDPLLEITVEGRIPVWPVERVGGYPGDLHPDVSEPPADRYCQGGYPPPGR